MSLSKQAKCETFAVKMSFICIIIENHFHINGFALSLVLKVRFFGTRKWPINRTVVCLELINPFISFKTGGFLLKGKFSLRSCPSNIKSIIIFLK